MLETKALFDACKKNNNRLGLMGLIYRHNDCYFHIIEGKEKDIDNLFSKIKTENIHKDSTVLLNQPITKFTFNDFTTGYNKVEDLNALFGLQEYHDYIVKNNLASKYIFLEIISNLFSVEL
ncbi:BLUF domain-containing protein [Lacinutrix sp.]|uniref:BLUF domain-containing protein n=1 Tax=Lacinutrix sp. TaxID=1937692 RepID=UPI0025C27EC6|nr:BLUF domain-containing protein [Lacinutrix sp.]